MKWYEMGFCKIRKTKKGKCIRVYEDWRVVKIHKNPPKAMSIGEAKLKKKIVCYANNAKEAREFARKVSFWDWNYAWNKNWK